jgi:hypothetical protein
MSGAILEINSLLDKTLIGRVLVIYSLCATAETEVLCGEFDQAINTVLALRRIIADVRIIAEEPHALSAGASRELNQILKEVEFLIMRAEQGIDAGGQSDSGQINRHERTGHPSAQR